MGWFSRRREIANMAARLEQLEAMRFSTTPPARASTMMLSLGMLDAPIKISSTSDPYFQLFATAWSYAACSATAAQLASLRPVVQRRGKRDRTDSTKAEDEWVEDREHPLNALIKAPHGPDSTPPNWGWDQLIEGIALHLLLCQQGAIIKKGDALGKLVALWLTNSWTATVDPDPLTGVPIAYRFPAGPVLLPTELVHITLGNPNGYLLSAPPFQAALKAVGIESSTESRQKAALENMIAPGMVITASGMFGVTEEQKLQVQKELRENYSMAAQTGRPLVIGEGSKIEAPPPPVADLGLQESRLWARDEILAVLGTPPGVLGITTQGAPPLMDQIDSWWTVRLFPMLNRIYESINRQAVAPAVGNAEVRIWYDLTDTQIGLILSMKKTGFAQSLVNLGFPANVAARKAGLGMPHVDGLDEVNQKATIAGRDDPQADPARQTPSEDPRDDDEEVDE
jgi:hypothetical protein